MGYDESVGLGRNAKGPTKLIEESKQKGLRGLGFSIKNFDDKSADWNFEHDPVRTVSCRLSSRFILIDDR